VKRKEHVSVSEAGPVDIPHSTLERQTHLVRVSELGSMVFKGLIKVSDRYFELCSYIRQHKVSEDVVRDALEPEGFVKQRISEINRVANAPLDLWTELSARRLSFRRTLELTRGTVQVLLTPDERASAPWVETIPDEPNWGVTRNKRGSGAADDKATRAKHRLERLFRLVCRQAENMGLNSRTAELENGYGVKVWKLKAKRKNPQGPWNKTNKGKGKSE